MANGGYHSNISPTRDDGKETELPAYVISPQPSEEREITFSSDGHTRTYIWQHNHHYPPNLVKLKGGCNNIPYSLMFDETEIYVTFEESPPPGTNNIIFYYTVS